MCRTCRPQSQWRRDDIGRCGLPVAAGAREHAGRDDIEPGALRRDVLLRHVVHDITDGWCARSSRGIRPKRMHNRTQTSKTPAVTVDPAWADAVLDQLVPKSVESMLLQTGARMALPEHDRIEARTLLFIDRRSDKVSAIETDGEPRMHLGTVRTISRKAIPTTCRPRRYSVISCTRGLKKPSPGVSGRRSTSHSFRSHSRGVREA